MVPTRSQLGPVAWALASLLAPLSGCRCQAKLDTAPPLGHCAKAGPGRGQLSFVATVAPPRLSFEPTCDGSLPLEAGPFRFNPATRVLSGRVRLWNRGDRAREDMVAFVDFLEGSSGDKRFRPHLSTLASVVTPEGRRGFLHGRIGPGQGAWARWSFVVPREAGTVIRGAGWVDPAQARAMRVELEELASGAPEGRPSTAGWTWLHRLDGYSGWGVLSSSRRPRPTSRPLSSPEPGSTACCWWAGVRPAACAWGSEDL